jgi:hypothetical protein
MPTEILLLTILVVLQLILVLLLILFFFWWEARRIRLLNQWRTFCLDLRDSVADLIAGNPDPDPLPDDDDIPPL